MAREPKKVSQLDTATVEALRVKLAITGGVAGSFTVALPTGTIATDKIYQYAGINATAIGGITWYNGDAALYNGTTWTRIPAITVATNGVQSIHVSALAYGKPFMMPGLVLPNYDTVTKTLSFNSDATYKCMLFYKNTKYDIPVGTTVVDAVGTSAVQLIFDTTNSTFSFVGHTVVLTETQLRVAVYKRYAGFYKWDFPCDLNVDGSIMGNYSSGFRIPNMSAVYVGETLGYVLFDTTLKTITFPVGFTVYINNDSASSVALTVPQVISLIPTDFASGNLLATSGGALIFNNITKEIRQIAVAVWSTTTYSGWTLIGFVKRSVSSSTVGGYPQVIGHFPYKIDGVNPMDNSGTILNRNYDIESAIAASCNYHKESTVSKSLQLLAMTDIHNDTLRILNAGFFAKKYTTIDAVACFGDIVVADNREAITDYLTFATGTGKPVLTTIGNHDVGNSKTVAFGATTAQAYAKYIQPLEAEMVVVNAGKNYWYKDYTTQKIRIINLYEYDDPCDLDTDTAYFKILRGMRVWSQAQLDWFCATLLATPTDYSVVVTLHQQIDSEITPVAGTFTDPAFNPVAYFQNLVSGNPITAIINAFVNGLNYTSTVTHTGDAAYLTAINVAIDFTARGVGKFICYIGGHVHKDAISTVNDFPTQKQISLTCSSADSNQNLGGDLRRLTGTKSEDALTLISFDTTNKKIKLVRIGANVTDGMTERKFISIDYV